MFDYDWFHGAAFAQQREEAMWRCASVHFPDLVRDEADDNEDVALFLSELETRSLIYLRDGFSYEVKSFAGVSSKSNLTFECEPVDEHYRVGSFVVTVPFEEIVRVEVFAVHPAEKPEDSPQITGFRAPMDPVGGKDGRPHPAMTPMSSDPSTTP